MKLYYQEQARIDKLKIKERQTYIQNENQKSLQDFLRQAEASKVSKQTYTKDQANRILGLLQDHPVAGMENLSQYDPKKEVGFCFGRAAYLHLELLRHGVKPEDTAKIFALGNLKAFGSYWDFHVGVLLRGPKGQWWVIDNLAGEVLSLDQWMMKIKTFARNQKDPDLRFYFTDALKFHPALGAYSEENMKFPYYNRYFDDLMNWFQNNPISVRNGFQKGS